MNQRLNVPKGTADILPSDIPRWEKLENLARDIAARYGFRQIRTPEFEFTSLFERGVGDSTDIVRKEMYTFTHRGGESFTLKPEGTAPVVRSFVENGMSSAPQPVKLFYLTNCFRAENPQKGRYRQFHQFGIEIFGAASPAADAEVITLAMRFFSELGLRDIELRINSVGCEHCRAAYYEKLRAFLADKVDKLCDDCKSRFERNPMRIIDCKNEHCQELIAGVPMMADELCDDCKNHFAAVQRYLQAAGVPFVLDSSIVRGLDYYTNTAFEFVPISSTGAQGSIGGGGRYNGLVETLGGPDTPGIGLAIGLERVLLQLNEQGINIDTPEVTDAYIAPLGDPAMDTAVKYAEILRSKGLSVQIDLMERSLKAQMKYADKINARYALMLGEDELSRGVFLVRNMQTKEQREIPFDMLAGELLK